MSTRSTGAVGEETMACIIPLVRKNPGRRNETWFVYEKRHTSTITETTTRPGDERPTVVTKEVTDMRERKVKLWTYGEKAEEDNDRRSQLATRRHNFRERPWNKNERAK